MIARRTMGGVEQEFNLYTMTWENRHMVQRQTLQRDGVLKTLAPYAHAQFRSSFMFEGGVRNPPPAGRHRVLVYGTLKKGYHNHRVIEQQGTIYLTNSSINGFIMLDLGSFPAIVRAPAGPEADDWSIRGELYEIEESALRACDRLEGVNSGFYAREEVELTHGDGKAWVYTRPTTELSAGQKFFPRGVWFATAPSYRWREGITRASLADILEPEHNGFRPPISEKPPVTQTPLLNAPGPVAISVVPPEKALVTYPYHQPHPMANAAPTPSAAPPALQVGPGVEEAFVEQETGT